MIKKTFIIILIAFLSVVALLCGTLVVLCQLRHTLRHIVTDTTQYEKRYGVFDYPPVVFPKSIDGLDVKKYLYKHKANILYDDQYILLTVKYSKMEWDKELERISCIKTEFAKVVYNNYDFEMPAYVAHMNDGVTSEMALLDDKNRLIHYFYVQYPPCFENEKFVSKKMLDSYED